MNENVINIWSSVKEWVVEGDGVRTPWMVVTEDAQGCRVGFMPLGFTLSAVVDCETQARALCHLLNTQRGLESWMGPLQARRRTELEQIG